MSSSESEFSTTFLVARLTKGSSSWSSSTLAGETFLLMLALLDCAKGISSSDSSLASLVCGSSTFKPWRGADEVEGVACWAEAETLGLDSLFCCEGDVSVSASSSSDCSSSEPS